jgi:hypothetical protein
MRLLYAVRSASMLLPNQCDPEWMDLSRVFSDNVPQAAGLGAVQLAQQALGLSPTAAAQLVVAAGATSLPYARLAAAAGAGLGSTQVTARGANATRVPISPNVVTTTALINGDPNRTFMLIQNNNPSGGANLLFSVDGAINTSTPWAYVNLAPTLGILLDEEIFVNPIYVAWGTGTVTGGVILFGSKASAGPSNAPQPAGAFSWGALTPP